MVVKSKANDVILFFYHLGVVLSGMFVAGQLATDDRWVLISFAIVLSVVWTAYFENTMHSRLADRGPESAE